MQHRTVFAITAGLVGLFGGLLAPSPAQALPIGNKLSIVNSTASIVTGDTWTVTAAVQDLLGQPVSGATLWTGVVEPSTGCGGDLTAADCTKLASTSKTSDSSGQVTLTKSATLDTFVVLYLADSQGALDPTTGQSVLVHTHNRYDWSGPSSVTLEQYAIGKAPYALSPTSPASTHRIATGNGAAGAPRTEVSTDGGATWSVLARGAHAGAFPVTGRGVTPVDSVNLMATKPGTYSVRITDGGGSFEDTGTSPVVTVTVTGRAQPGWLQRTNAYRQSLGLAPVADNPTYDAALAKHVRWMNIHKQLSHSETPGSTGYTKDGNDAAGASDLAFGRSTASLSVDGWIGAPFHASCLLNAYWAVGGFASANTWSGEWCHSSMQAFDLATGANGPLASSLRRNYTFPSAAMKVPLTVALNGNEAPDPAASCAGKLPNRTWSVPVIFRVARPPAADRGLKHATAGIKTKSGHSIKGSCLLTGSTYAGPDPASTQIGRLILGDRIGGRWAVLLVKAGALRAGHTYTAALSDGKLTQRTSFTLARH